MSAFLVNVELLTEKTRFVICGLIILRHLAPHLKLRLLTKTSSLKLLIAFASHLFSSLTDPNGILCEPLEYEEIAYVCSTLKLGVSGGEIDHEHIQFAGLPFWKLLFQLYQTFLNNFSVCDSLLTGVILSLFKRKGAKANNKDYYRSITLFPAFCKIYEMAEHQGLFSNTQFSFKEGVGCT